MGKSRAKAVIADQFILMDQSGVPKLIFSLDAIGEMPIIQLTDDNYRPRLLIGLQDLGIPSVSIFRNNGSLAISFGEDVSNHVGAAFTKEDGIPALYVVVHPCGSIEMRNNATTYHLH